MLKKVFTNNKNSENSSVPLEKAPLPPLKTKLLNKHL